MNRLLQDKSAITISLLAFAVCAGGIWGYTVWLNPSNKAIRCVGLWKSNNRRTHFVDNVARAIQDNSRISCIAGGVTAGGIDPRYKQDYKTAERFGVSARIASEGIMNVPEGYSLSEYYDLGSLKVIPATTNNAEEGKRLTTSAEYKQIKINAGTQVGWAYCGFNGSMKTVKNLQSEGWKIVSTIPLEYMTPNNSSGQRWMCSGMSYTLTR